jgi:hypothetical protein
MSIQPKAPRLPEGALYFAGNMPVYAADLLLAWPAARAVKA